MTQVTSRLNEIKLGSELLGGHNTAASETTASHDSGQSGGGDGSSRLHVLVRSGENVVGRLRDLEGHRSVIPGQVAHHLGVIVDGTAYVEAELKLEHK